MDKNSLLSPGVLPLFKSQYFAGEECVKCATEVESPTAMHVNVQLIALQSIFWAVIQKGTMMLR